MTMARAWSAEEWAEHFGGAARSATVTIGNFDGVHRGHREILKRVNENAKANGRASAVLTFYPHPAQVLRPAEAPTLLETIDQRLARLETCGVEGTLIARFNRTLAEMTPE